MKQIGNIIRYIIIIVADVAMMLLFHSYLNFILLVGLLLFPVYSIYGVYKVRDHFKLQLMAPLEPMEKGSEFLLRIVLHNPTWHPLLNATVKLEVENTLYREDGDHFLNLPVRARKKTEIVYPVVMDYSGHFAVNAKYICFMDLLGICELKVALSESADCLIVPASPLRSQEAGHIYIKGVSESMESKEKGYDFSEINGIREYIPGDKLQNIHWKLSVKKDELMVKERVSVSAMQLNVLVELANNEDMGLDTVLDLADSITKSFVKQNLPFTVYYYSVNSKELKECYIGNEVERMEWFSMMLYDQCYREVGQVEEMFLRHNGSKAEYLYIGYDSGETASDEVIYGEKGTVAQLRNR
ncbi:MAG: DUF58 domain-containing protein [Lachnospiraceae bacterium]|nr:DUF58 domain-containing protein [Lachnospiraceae bacterium]